MLEKLKDFYFKYAPTFTERYEKNKASFLLSKYVDDEFSNIAVVDEKTNLNLVDEEFNKLNLKSVYYSFSKPNDSFNVLYVDDYLYFENLDVLFAKYSKLKSKNIELLLVDNDKLRKEYMKINDECYSAVSYDNPYSNLNNFGYCKSVLDFQKNECETKTLLYIIKHNNQNVGCINLTIKDDLCYISGLAILTELRKTRVFLAMVDVLNILKVKGVKKIFCVTELGEYTDLLYKKLGFKSLGVAYAFRRK